MGESPREVDKKPPDNNNQITQNIKDLLASREIENIFENSGFVERFPELSLFYRLFSPLDSEMICIFPYFCPYAESVREIREIFV